MNVEYVNPFINSMSNTLDTMASLTLTRTDIGIKTSSAANGDISGIIKLESRRARGSLAITFSETFILEFSKHILGEIFSEINESVVDVVGELTNVVCGGAKKSFTEKGYDFNLAIPHILHGDHEVNHHFSGPTVVVNFATDFGDLFIEVCFEKSRRKKTR